MSTSAPRVTCVLVACVPTRRDPTLVLVVRQATECLKMDGGVKVSPSCAPHAVRTISIVKNVKDLSNTSVQFVNSPLKFLCCANVSPHFIQYL